MPACLQRKCARPLPCGLFTRKTTITPPPPNLFTCCFAHLVLPCFSSQQWGLSSSTSAVPPASCQFWLDSGPTSTLSERSCPIYFPLSQSICSGTNCVGRSSSSHLELSRKHIHTQTNEKKLETCPEWTHLYTLGGGDFPPPSLPIVAHRWADTPNEWLQS